MRSGGRKIGVDNSTLGAPMALTLIAKHPMTPVHPAGARKPRSRAAPTRQAAYQLLP